MLICSYIGDYRKQYAQTQTESQGEMGPAESNRIIKRHYSNRSISMYSRYIEQRYTRANKEQAYAVHMKLICEWEGGGQLVWNRGVPLGSQLPAVHVLEFY